MKAQARREFLKWLGGAAGLAAAPRGRAGGGEPGGEAGGLGMLYDATRCVGCKACMAACKRANGDYGGLAYERASFDPDALWDSPADLSGNTRTIIKLGRQGERWSFVKHSCMHCRKPSCVSACPVRAMTQDPGTGIVAYHKDRCIGCRYCQVACAFNIPRFQWDRSLPQIVKCDLCQETHLRERGVTACAEVCPTGAITFGRRADLVAEGHRRLAGDPDRYVPHLYGEHEVGGTNHLYLAALPFVHLGLPDLPAEAPAVLSEKLQHTIYRGFIAPVALYAALCAVALRHRRRQERAGKARGVRRRRPGSGPAPTGAGES